MILVLFAAEQHPQLNAMIRRKFSLPGDVESAFGMVLDSRGLFETKLLALNYSQVLASSGKESQLEGILIGSRYHRCKFFSPGSPPPPPFLNPYSDNLFSICNVEHKIASLGLIPKCLNLPVGSKKWTTVVQFDQQMGALNALCSSKSPF